MKTVFDGRELKAFKASRNAGCLFRGLTYHVCGCVSWRESRAVLRLKPCSGRCRFARRYLQRVSRVCSPWRFLWLRLRSER